MDPKLRSNSYNPNMDLELDPDLELTMSYLFGVSFCIV